MGTFAQVALVGYHQGFFKWVLGFPVIPWSDMITDSWHTLVKWACPGDVPGLDNHGVFGHYGCTQPLYSQARSHSGRAGLSQAYIKISHGCCRVTLPYHELSWVLLGAPVVPWCGQAGSHSGGVKVPQAYLEGSLGCSGVPLPYPDCPCHTLVCPSRKSFWSSWSAASTFSVTTCPSTKPCGIALGARIEYLKQPPSGVTGKCHQRGYCGQLGMAH